MHETEGSSTTSRERETIGRVPTATAGLPIADLLADPHALGQIADGVKAEWESNPLYADADTGAPDFFRNITVTVLERTAAWGQNLPTGKASTEGVVRDGMRAG